MLVPAIGSLFSVIGCWMSVLALRHGWRRRAFVQGSCTSEGTIVGSREDPDPTSDLHGTSFPRIRFQTSAGREITFESRLGSATRDWRVGQPITVRYRPAAPHTAEIDSFFALWGLALVFAVLGTVFLGLGLGLLLGFVPV